VSGADGVAAAAAKGVSIWGLVSSESTVHRMYAWGAVGGQKRSVRRGDRKGDD
jgi:hypothetical protein